jgi:hypothetical protein
MVRTRRELLSGLMITTTGLAGCGSVVTGEGRPTQTPRHQYLKRQRTYLGPDFGLDLSPYTRVVADPLESDVALLARETSVSGETVVAWLLESVAVGVYGRPAKERLFELLEAGDIGDDFDGGMAVGSGSQDMIVVYPVPEESRLIPLMSELADVSSGRTVAESRIARSIAADLGPFLKTADRHYG